MNRRAILQSAGVAALMGIAAGGVAQDHSQHKATASGGLAQAAGDCVRAGEACLAHCIEMLSSGDKSMAACAKSVNQLIPLCAALQALASQHSAHTAALAKVTMQVCGECQKECEKYSQHPVCRACAEACKNCHMECEKIAA